MPKRFRPGMLGVLLSMIVLPLSYLPAQTEHMPSGTATYFSHDDLMAIMQKTADQPASDAQVAVLDVNNSEYHIAVGIAHRSKASANTSGGASVEHSEVAEIYYIISGNAVLNTGGTMKDLKDPRPGAPNGPSGPSSSGGEIIGGVSKTVGPGDVVVIPPNTPHRFTAINSDEIVYVLVRTDPHKVLPVMNLLAR
jgi:mannose-6-phosphate isomerase-like protein (cupin superfamily)